LLIDVELFGWSLQYVRMDTNAEISGGRGPGCGLGARDTAAVISRQS
jgi:hypothetical protein